MKVLIITAVLFFIHTIAVETAAVEKSQNLMPKPQTVTYSNLLSSLSGRIVYLEPQQRRGYWVYARELTPYLTIKAKDQLLEEIPFKWKVHNLGRNRIALESMQDRNDYMSIRVNGQVKNNLLKTTGDPSSDTWVHIELVDPHLYQTTLSTYITFPESKKYGIYLGLKHNSDRYTTLSPTPQKWNIYIPDASDEYATVTSLDNRFQPNDATLTFTATIGVHTTRGETVSESLETTLGIELKGAFMSGNTGITHTSTWERQTSETWSRTSQTALHTTVPAGKRIELRQLIGHYGNNKIVINSGSFQFVDPDTKEVVEKDISKLHTQSYAQGI